MLKLVRVLVSAIFLAAPGACANKVAPDEAKAAAPQPAEFRMRMYQVVLLRRGPAWSPEKTPEVEAIFKGHMAHLQRMAGEGKMVLAGPFDAPQDGGVGTPVGLCVYTVETRAEAERLASEDPAVMAGRFTVDVLPWYGPEGITYAGAEQFVRSGPPSN